MELVQEAWDSLASVPTTISDNIAWVIPLALADFVGQYVGDLFPKGDTIMENRFWAGIHAGLIDSTKLAIWTTDPVPSDGNGEKVDGKGAFYSRRLKPAIGLPGGHAPGY